MFNHQLKSVIAAVILSAASAAQAETITVTCPGPVMDRGNPEIPDIALNGRLKLVLNTDRRWLDFYVEQARGSNVWLRRTFAHQPFDIVPGPSGTDIVVAERVQSDQYFERYQTVQYVPQTGWLMEHESTTSLNLRLKENRAPDYGYTGPGGSYIESTTLTGKNCQRTVEK